MGGAIANPDDMMMTMMMKLHLELSELSRQALPPSSNYLFCYPFSGKTKEDEKMKLGVDEGWLSLLTLSCHHSLPYLTTFLRINTHDRNWRRSSHTKMQLLTSSHLQFQTLSSLRNHLERCTWPATILWREQGSFWRAKTRIWGNCLLYTIRSEVITRSFSYQPVYPARASIMAQCIGEGLI